MDQRQDIIGEQLTNPRKAAIGGQLSNQLITWGSTDQGLSAGTRMQAEKNDELFVYNLSKSQQKIPEQNEPHRVTRTSV